MMRPKGFIGNARTVTKSVLFFLIIYGKPFFLIILFFQEGVDGFSHSLCATNFSYHPHVYQ